MLESRRLLNRRIAAGIAGLLVGLRAAPSKAAVPVSPGVPHVVYHLSDFPKVHFVLGNLQNHIDGMGGPDKVSLTLVVHGPALDYFTVKGADQVVIERMQALGKAGVTFVACGNTMKANNLKPTDLSSGFSVADEGGVVRIAKLQAEGYLYLRP